jgi:hypothetical protein
LLTVLPNLPNELGSELGSEPAILGVRSFSGLPAAADFPLQAVSALTSGQTAGVLVPILCFSFCGILSNLASISAADSESAICLSAILTDPRTRNWDFIAKMQVFLCISRLDLKCQHRRKSAKATPLNSRTSCQGLRFCDWAKVSKSVTEANSGPPAVLSMAELGVKNMPGHSLIFARPQWRFRTGKFSLS